MRPARGRSEEISVGSSSFVIQQLSSGGTGRDIFPSARILLELLSQLREDWRDVEVLELGAGTGVVSVGLAKLGARVVATDSDAAVLKNLRRNAHTNGVAGRIRAVRWDWAEDLPSCLRAEEVSYCLGSDLAFGSSYTPLCKALCALKAANPSVGVHLVLQEREGLAVQALQEACHEAGLSPRNRQLRVVLIAGAVSVTFLREDVAQSDASEMEEQRISFDFSLFEV